MPQDTVKGERIAKVIARAGVASRRDAEKLISAGLVLVNGVQIDSPALNVSDTDRIVVDGTPLEAPDVARVWIYHKPIGQVTTDRDEKGRQTVFDALPEDMPRVMSVGRLDINGELADGPALLVRCRRPTGCDFVMEVPVVIAHLHAVPHRRTHTEVQLACVVRGDLK